MEPKINLMALLPELFQGDYVDRAPAYKRPLPTGPMKPAGEGREGSLLLFVARNAISATIDKVTGGYGYSHLAIDCGEMDIPTGKRVMIESTPGLGVHYSFQDQYGAREFIRIPLERTGISVEQFCDAIHSKLGEPYSRRELLTFGLLVNPVKQTCCNLATVCLPPQICADIARHYRRSFLNLLPMVRVYGNPDRPFRLFVTPNGFAKYFGAPRGQQIRQPDQLMEPVLPSGQIVAVERGPMTWGIWMAVLCSLALVWVLARPDTHTRRKYRLNLRV